MISKSEYEGNIPYEEYVRRFKTEKRIQDKLLKQTEAFTSKTDTDIESTQKAQSDATALQAIAKAKMEEAIKNQTGIDTTALSKAYNDAFHKGKEPTDPQEKREKKDIQSGILLARATKPSLDTLPADAVQRAKMSNAGKIAYLNDDNFQAAQEYLDREGTNAVIDTELSDGSGLVVRRPATPGVPETVEIHYRGTSITNKVNPDDLHTDARIASGTEGDSVAGLPVGKPKQIADAEAQFERVRAKYGSVEHLGGYSRGGGMAVGIGNKYNVPSTTFNPLIGPRHLTGDSEAIHQVYRTTEDPVSLGLAFANKNNIKVDTVKPLAKFQQNILSFNPKNLLRHITNVYDSHRLDNFTSGGQRKLGEAELDVLQRELQIRGRKMAQAPQLIDITNSIKNGDSFSEMLVKGTHAADVVQTPKGLRLKGARHSINSNLVQNWIDAGGEFTNGEAKHINDTTDGLVGMGDISKENSDMTKRNRKRRPISDDEQERLNKKLVFSEDKQNQLTPEEKILFSGTDTEAQKAKLLEYKSETNDIMQTMEESGLDGLSREGNSMQEFSRNMNLTNLALGGLIGKGSSEAFNLIPGYKKLSEVKKSAIEGGTAGVGQALAQEALGGKKLLGARIAGLVGEGSVSALGYAALAPELVGGIAGAEAGQAVGTATAEGIAKLGGGKDLQDLGADTAGGAAGGAASGLAAALVAVGSDALFGTELGATFGPAGAITGAAFGLGIGAFMFAGGEAYKGVKALASKVGDWESDIASWF